MISETPASTPAPKSRTPLYIGLGVVLVIALVGAAFVGGRLLNQKADEPQTFGGPEGVVVNVNPGGSGSGDMGFLSGGPGGAGGGDVAMPSGPAVNVTPGGPGSGDMGLSGGGPAGAEGGNVAIPSGPYGFTPATEVPQTSPEVIGVFLRREDKRLFLGIGDPSASLTTSSDGVIGDGGSGTPSPQMEVEVVVTRDTKIYRDTTNTNEAQMQQTVVPGKMDDLTSQTMVSVWGRRVGDRVIADVLLFSVNVIFGPTSP